MAESVEKINSRVQFTFTLQAELLSVLFVPVNVAGPTPGRAEPPSFGDLFSKFWKFFENPFFAI